MQVNVIVLGLGLHACWIFRTKICVVCFMQSLASNCVFQEEDKRCG